MWTKEIWRNIKRKNKKDIYPLIFIGIITLLLFVEYFRLGEFYYSNIPGEDLIRINEFDNAGRTILSSVFSIYAAAYVSLTAVILKGCFLVFHIIFMKNGERKKKRIKKIILLGVLIFGGVLLSAYFLYIYWHIFREISTLTKFLFLVISLISVWFTIERIDYNGVIKKSLFIILGVPFVYLLFSYLHLFQIPEVIPNYPVALGILLIEALFYLVSKPKERIN